MGNGNHLDDLETRTRLLKAAARLFAERGFNHVSVREICREAGTNVAAVNYHFRDKLSFYRELIGSAADEMNRNKLAALDAGAAEPPEDQLRTYIRHFLHQLLDSNDDGWIDKLIAREMADPTPALDLMIEKGIRPTAERLDKLVGEILSLPATDSRVRLGAGSVQGLCLWVRSSRTVAERMVPGLAFTPPVVDGMAKLLAEFALGGLRAMVKQDEGLVVS